jgi:hyperosmotically inducible periplasmic protein
MMMRTGAVFAAALALALCGCEREAGPDGKLSTTITIEQKLPAGAERQIERAGAMLDDAAVSAKVKAALVGAPDLPALSINVDTTQNVVTLTGLVHSQEESERAERTARAVEGVKQVHNKLTIRPS